MSQERSPRLHLPERKERRMFYGLRPMRFNIHTACCCVRHADGLSRPDNDGFTFTRPYVFLEQPVHLDDNVSTTKSVVLADWLYSGVPEITIDSSF